MHKINETIIKIMVMVEAANLELELVIWIHFFYSNHDISKLSVARLNWLPSYSFISLSVILEKFDIYFERIIWLKGKLSGQKQS